MVELVALVNFHPNYVAMVVIHEVEQLEILMIQNKCY